MANTNSWFDYSFIGIRLNIPIFDGLRKQKQRRQVEFKIQKINEEIEFAQNKVVASYEDAIQILFIGFQSISVQEENLKLAEEIYKQSRLLYKEGLYSTTDLLQAEVTFQKAQSAYWLEIIKYKKAELDLMKTKGTLNNLLNYK